MNCSELIDNITEKDIINLMERLGVTSFKETKDALIFPTICHNEAIEEASMKLYYYKNSKIFYCYSEDGPMSVFRFLEQYYTTRKIDYDWFEDVFSVLFSQVLSISEQRSQNFEKLADKYEKRKAARLPIYSEGVLDCFIHYYPIEWLNDGITEQAMDKFNILYSISQNKIIIPHYDIEGRLIGIRGRALNDWEVENVGKYMPVKVEQKWYSHPLSLNLYGLNKTKNNIKKYGICYLLESEKAILQLENFSIPNCGVAVCGSNFNKYQLDILLKECNPKEVVICFDKEELPYSDSYYKKLKSICQRYNNYCNFSFVYDKEKLLRLKESPTDRGEEVFEKLLRKRVQVK